MGTPRPVSDLGAVLGGLISDRVSGEDLIILCGGPGSGKSTLSRILASELAADPNVYPVFLRLRRLKEGSDIPGFLDSELSRFGVIDRIRDLRELKNVVVILDGFDELVMASRARLRQFFNSLREDHLSGPLKGARIIVSGRDTLFPGGEGLPVGCHVLTLVPFDKARVNLWGRKWRNRHKTGKGSTFYPEKLVSDARTKSSALQHLVTWPLTLHLVARAHTSGRMNIDPKKPESITKAILYRSILAETSVRQRDKTDGVGRLEPQAMREFLRELAWRMYEEGRDSMDPSEVLPILKRTFSGKSDSDLAELADVTVVNSPEITKGEQTGFEFVHKSFAEYLTAERIANTLERVTFQVRDYDGSLNWRMSEADAVVSISAFAATRPLTKEVQEMLEPMLGDFQGFGGEGGPRLDIRRDGLARVVERFESLLDGLVRGQWSSALSEGTKKLNQQLTLFESTANCTAGILFIGASAARQLSEGKGAEPSLFNLQLVDGSIWRLLSILHAGGVYIDSQTAFRMFRGCKVNHDSSTTTDLDFPIKTAWLEPVEGFENTLPRMVEAAAMEYAQLALGVQLLAYVYPQVFHNGPEWDSKYMRYTLQDRYGLESSAAFRLFQMMSESGYLTDDRTASLRHFTQEFQYEMRRFVDFAEFEKRPPKEAIERLWEFMHYQSRAARGRHGGPFLEYLMEFIRRSDPRGFRARPSSS